MPKSQRTYLGLEVFEARCVPSAPTGDDPAIAAPPYTRTIYEGADIDMSGVTAPCTIEVKITTDDGNVETITVTIPAGADPSAKLVEALKDHGNATENGITPIVTIGVKKDPTAPDGVRKITTVDAKFQVPNQQTWTPLKVRMVKASDWT